MESNIPTQETQFIPDGTPTPSQPNIQQKTENNSSPKLGVPILGLALVVIVIYFAYTGFIQGLTYIPSNPFSIVAGLLSVIGVSILYFFSKKTISVKFSQNSILSNIQINKEIKYILAFILWFFAVVIFVSVFFVHDPSAHSRYDARGVSGGILALIGDILWFSKS